MKGLKRLKYVTKILNLSPSWRFMYVNRLYLGTKHRYQHCNDTYRVEEEVGVARAGAVGRGGEVVAILLVA
jgi:hypothetical protein